MRSSPHPEAFSDVRLQLEEAGIEMAQAEVTMIPQTYVELTSEDDIKNIQKTLDLLDEDDDVRMYIITGMNRKQSVRMTDRRRYADEQLQN